MKQKTGAKDAIWSQWSCLGPKELVDTGGVPGVSKHHDKQEPGFMRAHRESPRAVGIGLVLGLAEFGVHHETWHILLSSMGEVSLPASLCPGWGNGGSVNLFFLPSLKCPFLFLCFTQVL